MNKWPWYVGWLLGWFALWTFVFVPVSNLFRYGGFVDGAIRGLILMSGWVVLYYGFRFINRKLPTRESDVTGPRELSDAVVSGGMSEREIAFLAAARKPAPSTHSAAQSDADVTRPHLALDVTVTRPRPAPDTLPTNNVQDAPSSVMKSAGNPLVRKAFAAAMEEVKTKTYEPGLWAMSLVECNGDERAAGLAYMKARAAEMAWADAKAAESAQMAARQQQDELSQMHAVQHREVKRNEPETGLARLATLSNLFQAVRQSRLDDVTWTVRTYPDSIGATTSNGQTPLHIAVDERNLPIVKALLELGASPRVRDNCGDSAIDIAMRKGTPAIVSELQKYLGRH